ncbi:hypothetical protein Syun_018955 [Stephania yunnanensis]|uniref:Uncharacterized protein n=1 Tax=Stephania yunnanensis TaxID=152371 RepID=A0AAP0IUU4_9MAGN
MIRMPFYWPPICKSLSFSLPPPTSISPLDRTTFLVTTTISSNTLVGSVIPSLTYVEASTSSSSSFGEPQSGQETSSGTCISQHDIEKLERKKLWESALTLIHPLPAFV